MYLLRLVLSSALHLNHPLLPGRSSSAFRHLSVFCFIIARNAPNPKLWHNTTSGDGLLLVVGHEAAHREAKPEHIRL